MKKQFYYTFVCLVVALLATTSVFSQSNVKNDTITKDSVPQLKYNFKYNQKASLFLNGQTKYSVTYNKQLDKYIVVELIGKYKVGVPKYMTPIEFMNYRLKNDMKAYF